MLKLFIKIIPWKGKSGTWPNLPTTIVKGNYTVKILLRKLISRLIKCCILWRFLLTHQHLPRSPWRSRQILLRSWVLFTEFVDYLLDSLCWVSLLRLSTSYQKLWSKSSCSGVRQVLNKSFLFSWIVIWSPEVINGHN